MIVAGLTRKSGYVDVRSFGAKGDGVTDDLAAFQAAVAAYSTTRGGIYVPPTADGYFLDGTLVINKPVHLFGSVNSSLSSMLKFRRSQPGIQLNYQGGPVAGGGQGSVIEHLRVIPSVGTIAWQATTGYIANGSMVIPTTGWNGVAFLCTTGGTSGGTEPTWNGAEGGTTNDGSVVWTAVYIAGIYMKCRAMLNNVTSAGWAGDGVAVRASTVDGDNANLFAMRSMFSTQNLGRGFYFNGADSNAGMIEQCSAIANSREGFFDDSFLGNTFTACHTEANVGRSYRVQASNVNARSLFMSCYHELGQPIPEVQNKATWIGGLIDTGFPILGSGTVIRNEGCGALTFNQDTVGDGTGQRAQLRLARFASQVVLEMGWEQDGFNVNQLGYGIVNGAAQTGWAALLRAGTLSAFGFSLGNAAEGAGHFWTPNKHFIGPPANRTANSQVTIGPPSSGAAVAGDFAHESAPGSTGMFGFVCLTAGTPGAWAPLQPFGLRGVATSDTVILKDRYIGVTSVAAQRTLSLPALSSVPEGWRVTVKDETGLINLGSNSNIVILPNGSDVIDNQVSMYIQFPYGSIEIVKRNSKWWVTDRSNALESLVGNGYSGTLTLQLYHEGTLFANTGAVARADYTLPATPRIGMMFEFFNDDADGTRVIPNSGQTIVYANTSTSNGLEALTVGSYVKVRAVTATKWAVIADNGTWTVL